MIQNSSVLILGAGSNIGLGFPSGSDLVQNICTDLGPVSSTLINLLLGLGISKAEIDAFRDRLLGSELPAIDAFLEKNPKLERVGKAAIAGVLMAKERKNVLNQVPLQTNDPWYTDLHQLLVGGTQMRTPIDLTHNRLTIITYNYDRSLEYYLSQKLHMTFGDYITGHDDAKQYLQFMRFLHVHGDLGNYLSTGDDFRDYGGPITPQTAELCINRLRIIHEVDETRDYEDIYKIIEEAKRIFFLGFGYGEENMRRLLTRKDLWKNGKYVFGSTHGVPHNRIITIQNKFKELGALFTPGGSDELCSAIIKPFLV